MPEIPEGPQVSLSGHHVRGSRGQIFLLLRQPPKPKGAVLVVPPFAEEMNKSRAMVTRLSQSLAVQGVATVMPDLFGTGDSDGDFGDASWECWQDDLQSARAWCTSQRIGVFAILAIRLGAALAVAATASGRFPSVERTVFWQPTLDGARHLTQFLRLRVAALLASEGRNATVAMLREAAARGETLEVAGYQLSPALVAELDSVAPPDRLPSSLGQVLWIEVVRSEATVVPEASRRLIDTTRAQGEAVALAIAQGEPFWATTEITVNPQVIDTTVAFLAAGGELSASQVGQ